MRSATLALGSCLGILAAGCGYPPLPARDAGVEPCVSFASLLDTCQLAFDGDLTITGMATYDTDSHVLTVGGAETEVAHTTVMIAGDEVDVISARNVRIAASSSLRGVGNRPLAIIASDTFTVEASALISIADGGAGAQTSCASGAAVGQPGDTGAGGGGGGGYGADGGNGASGNGAAGGMMGRAVASVPLGLRGGCPGAAGGDGKAPGGAGGAGGGALYVVAANRIELNSLRPITAGGGGGRGGARTGSGGDAGGGGGGSGGMLILEAPHIAGTNATIAANGGGGGEGSDDVSAGDAGDPGTISTTRASGGSGNATTGTDGGLGGSVELPTGESVTGVLSGGGGGGGGGVGFIRIISPDVQGVTTSPNLSP